MKIFMYAPTLRLVCVRVREPPPAHYAKVLYVSRNFNIRSIPERLATVNRGIDTDRALQNRIYNSIFRSDILNHPVEIDTRISHAIVIKIVYFDKT